MIAIFVIAVLGLLLAVSAVMVGIDPPRATPVGAEQKRPGWKRQPGRFFLLWLCPGQRRASTFPFHRCGQCHTFSARSISTLKSSTALPS
jgi:hypothetical protein